MNILDVIDLDNLVLQVLTNMDFALTILYEINILLNVAFHLDKHVVITSLNNLFSTSIQMSGIINSHAIFYFDISIGELFTFHNSIIYESSVDI
ncbi:hypothetical protein B0W47_16720 (plasmid) [Komagataeibacter nataicola]|uniref:Uncharacterized protein n=1 Tax=Komagataeibacter nataicola TaxID=265960 RepID=A0A9N7CQQ4_9PROT|nr:hypothetical protein B0W47_16720 [Komagataeibacter nataicola]PYD66261.1 hypothetical protein CDI09_08930 [Komagataeibacter nataicola]